MQLLYDLFGLDSAAVARHILTTIFSLAVLLILLKITGRLFRRREKTLSAQGRDMAFLKYLRYMLHVALCAIFLLGVLRNVPGINTLLTGLLAGSGIAALTLGLASQQAIGNIVSGAMLLLFRPFQLGDTVRYLSDDITGVIEEIGLRHTTIRTAENKRLFVPNNLMNSNVVENFSAENPAVSVCLEIAVPYEADTLAAMTLMAKTISGHPDFSDRRSDADKEAGLPPVSVKIKSLDGASVKLRAWVWAADSFAASQLKSDLLLAIKTSFQKAGLTLK